MKRDVQVGVILGVIILAVIGVFLSTKTTVKEPTIPIPELEEEQQVGMLNVRDLPQAPPNAAQSRESFKEVSASGQSAEQKEQSVSKVVKVEEKPAANNDNVVEGVWKHEPVEEPAKATIDDQKPQVVAVKEDWKDVPLGDGKSLTGMSRTYKVQYRDDLRKIAKKFYGDVSKWVIILNANQKKILDRNNLKAGIELVIPDENSISQKPKKETTTPALSHTTIVTETKPAAKTHIVRQGDTLYKLAEKYYKNSSKSNKIAEANKKIIKNGKSLKIGQELIIPDP